MNVIAIYSGTFDPITFGHIDLINKSSKLFEHTIIAIANNTKKETLFPLQKRIDLVKEALFDIPNIEVVGFSGLFVDFAASRNAKFIVRGIRTVSDFGYELQMALTNRALNSEIETIFLSPSEQYSYLSSTLVREIGLMGGDISKFVPKCVVDAFKMLK
jgi:pantetheine-phosphate adenylyltransferase